MLEKCDKILEKTRDRIECRDRKLHETAWCDQHKNIGKNKFFVLITCSNPGSWRRFFSCPPRAKEWRSVHTTSSQEASGPGTRCCPCTAGSDSRARVSAAGAFERLYGYGIRTAIDNAVKSAARLQIMTRRRYPSGFPQFPALESPTFFRKCGYKNQKKLEH